ncbi:MAG TPA: hypothetical protein VF777_13270 [Phycisphaerales bacterium]
MQSDLGACNGASIVKEPAKCNAADMAFLEQRFLVKRFKLDSTASVAVNCLVMPSSVGTVDSAPR